jgi:hypothetical protein
MNALDQESRISVSAWDWRNINNRRVALSEIWYATYVRGLVLNLGTRTVEFDKSNPIHMAAIGSGQFKPTPAIYRKLRAGIWFGPHLLHDYDPGTNRMPYVPFWGFREDLTGVPYGLIRSMMPLQDEVNARRRKLMWLLSSKRVEIDADALDQRYNDFQTVMDEISRPDSMIIRSPSRTHADGIKVESDLGLSQQQFEVLQDAKSGIQEAAGIYNTVLGKSDSGASSGVAMNTLVEQSSNTLGEINDNFKFSRQQVGERLLTLIRQDMTGRQIDVVAGESDARRKVISLNVPKTDDLTGVQYAHNDVDKANVKVALEDIPSTPAYRQQQMLTLGETIKALPPAAQAAMIPFYIEATDLPKRHKMADLARKAMGLPTDGEEPPDPQVQQLQTQLQQLHQQSDAAMQKYEQAVQEKTQESQQLGQQVAQLQLQVRDKAMELQVKQQEIQTKAQADQATAAAKMRELAIKEADQQLAAKRLELDHAQLQIDSMARQSELQRTQADQEHSQLSAAAQAEADRQAAERDHALKLRQHQDTIASAAADAQHQAAQAEAQRQHDIDMAVRAQAAADEAEDKAEQKAEQLADQKAEPKEDEGKELKQIQATVEKLLAPLAKQLEQIASTVAADAKDDATETKGKTKPKGKRLVIQRDANGRMTGATIDES